MNQPYLEMSELRDYPTMSERTSTIEYPKVKCMSPGCKKPNDLISAHPKAKFVYHSDICNELAHRQSSERIAQLEAKLADKVKIIELMEGKKTQTSNVTSSTPPPQVKKSHPPHKLVGEWSKCRSCGKFTWDPIAKSCMNSTCVPRPKKPVTHPTPAPLENFDSTDWS